MKVSEAEVNEDPGKRFQRLLGILRSLATTQGATVKELAQKYGKTGRTIERDISDLRYACFDIEKLGRGKGWRVDPQYASVGQTLALEEILCLSLGSQIIASSADPELDEFRRAGASKLHALIKRERRLAAAEAANYFAVGGTIAEHRFIPELLRSIANLQALEIQYETAGESTVKTRVLEPWTLLYQSEVWHVHGLDRLTGKPRTFRVHRIRECRATEEKYAIPSDYRADKAVFHRWDLSEGGPSQVACQVEPELSRWLAENPVHPSQKIENGRLHLEVKDLDRLAAWILGLQGLRVLEPASLQEKVRERARAMLALHDEKAGLDR